MKRIAIIGSGPRGMSVLERLVTITAENPPSQRVEIILIDEKKIGEGRVWNSAQSKNYIMNTLSTEISAFSGIGPVDGAKPGYGPSFAQWWQANYDDFDSYQGFAPRAYYGEYLHYVYQTIQEHLPKNVFLFAMVDEVIDIELIENTCLLHMREQGDLNCNSVVLATGHPVNEYQGQFKQFETFANTTAGISFIGGDSSSNIDFSQISPLENVGVVGLGLSFFDTVSELTEGRGGCFSTLDTDEYVYIPSGKEPRLFCGSRSGLPLLARGVNEKSSTYKHQHCIFTKAKIEKMRARAGKDICFNSEIWCLIEAEVNLAYFEQWIANTSSIDAAQHFKSGVIDNGISTSTQIALLASSYLDAEVKALDLKALARPFEKCRYETEKGWQEELLALLEQDLNAAQQGNVRSPLKSALDVLRHSRDEIRAAVDFGGLTAGSHKDFLYEYVPIISLLSAGPPLFRIKQLIALIKAGVVSIIPPKMAVSVESNGYHITSEVAPYCSQIVSTLIDARIPSTNIYLDKSPLIRNLFEKGVLSSFMNFGSDGKNFDTAGVNVTESPFYPIGRDGVPRTNLFVLGIPTEHTRWFMQSGSSRPGHWIDFMIDADAVARGALYGPEDQNLAA